MAEQKRGLRSSKEMEVPRGAARVRPSQSELEDAPKAQKEQASATEQVRGRHSAQAIEAKQASGYATTKPVAVGAAARKAQAQAAQDADGEQTSSKKEKKRKKKASIGWRVLFWIALIVFVGALGTLGVFTFSYWNGQQRANDLANDVLVVNDTSDSVYLSDLQVDWDALRAKNSEVVAWIYMPGTVINYPVAYSGDDEKYLTTTFDGYSSVVSYGTIFLEGQNSPTFSDQMNIMYGHNMLDGSMFAALTKFDDNDEFNSHRTVFLLTPMGNYRLTTFALLHVDATDPLVQQNFPSDGGFESYIQNKMNRSVVTPDTPIPNASDITKAFALITCDDGGSNSGRYVLYCYIAESTVPEVEGLEQDGDRTIDISVAEGLGMQLSDK